MALRLQTVKTVNIGTDLQKYKVLSFNKKMCLPITLIHNAWINVAISKEVPKCWPCLYSSIVLPHSEYFSWKLNLFNLFDNPHKQDILLYPMHYSIDISEGNKNVNINPKTFRTHYGLSSLELKFCVELLQARDMLTLLVMILTNQEWSFMYKYVLITYKWSYPNS